MSDAQGGSQCARPCLCLKCKAFLGPQGGPCVVWSDEALERTQSTVITRATREGGPRIEERKRGHVYDYAERTTRYVLLDPDVERVRGEAARTANRERDRWF